MALKLALKCLYLLFQIHLNNANVSCEYVDTLCTTLMEDVIKSIPGMTQNDRGKLESCISGLSGVTANLKSIEDYGMQQLRSSAIKPRVNPWLDEFLNISHDITEVSRNQHKGLRVKTRSLIQDWDSDLYSS